MLPILLTILKITGTVILAILALALLILLTVLLVPVRYSLSGSYYGKPKGKLRVSWLLRAVSVSITYEDKPDVAVRILGKRLFQKKETVQVKERDFEPEGEIPEVDFVENPGEGQQEAARSDEDPCRAEEILGEDTETDDGIRLYGAGESPQEDFRDYREEAEEYDDPKQGSEKKKRKPKAGRKDSPKGGKIKDLAESLREKWARLEEYKTKAVSFWNDERNRETIKVILRQAKGIIRHVLPRKARGKAVFGFDDPGTTGKVLAGLSVVYGWYGDKVEIVPVFDRKILEAEGSLRGRVQAGVILGRCVRVLLNKNFRRQVWSLIRKGGSRHGRD